MIYIEPCQTLSVTSLQAISDMTYTLGDALGPTSQAYSFEQAPNCEYEITYEVVGLPGIAVHNEPFRSFTVPYSEDKSLIGNYPVTVLAHVTHFADHTKNTNLTVSTPVNFNIEIIDPCPDTILNDLVINDMERAVKQPGISQKVFEPKDSVSNNFGT